MEVAVDENLPLAVSNTGPLISAFQSDSFDLIIALFGAIHTSEACVAELTKHGWEVALAQAGSNIVTHKLTDPELEQAEGVAGQIAAHPVSKEPDPDNHLGEAEVMVLVQRPEFAKGVLLLDELAARAVARDAGLTISGFAGVLLLAVDEGLLTADDVRERLEQCRQQGTHYSVAFIERVYQAAKEGDE